MSPAPLVLVTPIGDGIVRLGLNRPGRGNSLNPDLLEALLEAVEQNRGARAVVVTGEGRAFSSGGDIAGFRDHSATPDMLTAYSDRIVGTLNRVILALRDLPCPTLAGVNGPVTGGSLGLMLACDCVIMSRSAFIQPYYARMGFAPDGGWTAMLPDRIGPARTQAWIARDDRVDATNAFAIGLADELTEPEAFEAALAHRAHQLAAQDAGTIRTARRLVQPDLTGDRLAERLDVERLAFLDLIARPETAERMKTFLAGHAA